MLRHGDSRGDQGGSEADIRAYVDGIDRKKLSELFQIRIADTSFLRLLGKCLDAGVLDGEQYSEPEEGTADPLCR